MSEKVIPLILYKKYEIIINKEYLKYAIANSNIKDFCFTNKAGKGKIADISIRLPINNNDDISIELQNQIVIKYEKINKFKKNITEKISHLIEQEIIF